MPDWWEPQTCDRLGWIGQCTHLAIGKTVCHHHYWQLPVPCDLQTLNFNFVLHSPTLPHIVAMAQQSPEYKILLPGFTIDLDALNDTYFDAAVYKTAKELDIPLI